MALIGEMQYLTIGGNTYSLPVGGGGTVTSVAVSNATNGGLSVSGSPITSNGTITIGHSNVLASAQTTSGVYPIKIDKNGHISEYGTAVTIPTKTSDLTNDSEFITGMTILSYGNSTWQNFIDAYNANKVVYCRASSNSNPASGSQTRLAFMAYVNNATNPTEVEFQYYRSVNTHTAAQQGDQVFVYKLTSAGTWTVTTREASAKVVAGTGLSSTYSNDTITLTGPTKVSDLTNDSGFITLTDVPEEVFVVTITYSNNEYSFNKTYAQIIAAYNAGKHIVGHDISFNNYYYIKSVYEHSTEGQITFSNFIDVDEPFSSESKGYIVCNVIYMDSSNNITSYTCQLAVPTRTSHLTNNSGFITLNDVPTTHSIPSGGTAGQALAKNSATDYDVSWVNVMTTAAQIIRWTEST